MHGLPSLTSKRRRADSRIDARSEAIRSTLGGARRPTELGCAPNRFEEGLREKSSEEVSCCGDCGVWVCFCEDQPGGGWSGLCLRCWCVTYSRFSTQFRTDAQCVSTVPRSWGEYRGGSNQAGLAFEASDGTLRFVTNLPCGAVPVIALEVRRTTSSGN